MRAIRRFTTPTFLIPIVAVASLGFLFPGAAEAQRSRTTGGTSTDVSHNGKTVYCTWESFEGEWFADPGDPSVEPPVPAIVRHDVTGDHVAKCSGWDIGADEVVNPTAPFPHENAPYGFGQFEYFIEYQAAASPCNEDDNAGIGNNCDKKTDRDHPNKKGGSGGAGQSSVSCANNPDGPGSTLTYSFFCEDGVSVAGHLTLVPGTASESPMLDLPGCDPDGECTLVLGGLPTTTVKVKGKNVQVVDPAACADNFPGGPVPNALGSGQDQILVEGEILFYEEQSSATCAASGLPSVPGDPVAAFGVYCQSSQFDNVLRVCPQDLDVEGNPVNHIGSHDVETFALLEDIVFSNNKNSLNLKCQNQDNFKIEIFDQPDLLAAEVQLVPPPTLRPVDGTLGPVDGIAISASQATLVTDPTTLQQKVVLLFPTCNDPSIPQYPVGPVDDIVDAIIEAYPGIQLNDDVVLQLQGAKSGTGVVFFGATTVKVVGVP